MIRYVHTISDTELQVSYTWLSRAYPKGGNNSFTLPCVCRSILLSTNQLDVSFYTVDNGLSN